jgi:hypothetical protein
VPVRPGSQPVDGCFYVRGVERVSQIDLTQMGYLRLEDGLLVSFRQCGIGRSC